MVLIQVGLGRAGHGAELDRDGLLFTHSQRTKTNGQHEILGRTYNATSEEEERGQCVERGHDQTGQRLEEDGGDADEAGEQAEAAREGGVVDGGDGAVDLGLDQADGEAEDDTGADELEAAGDAVEDADGHVWVSVCVRLLEGAV